MGAIVQAISLLCLMIIVYIIGRSIIKTSSHSTAKSEDKVTKAVQEEKTTSLDDKLVEDKTEKKEETRATLGTTEQITEQTTANTFREQVKDTSSNKVLQQTEATTVATEATTRVEISTRYGPETDQDGNSVAWISQQKDVIEMEKDGYELRSKGKSGIQYIDPNGDVAKTLYQPEDSVDGQSYEEYYYQGNELIYVSIWSVNGDGQGEQYYFNNRNLVQWVDSSGLIYNQETRGGEFGESSNWKQYLSAGIKAMQKSQN